MCRWDSCVLGLQNDHKSVMKDIEEGLHKIHALSRDNETIKDEKPRQGLLWFD